MQPSDASKPAAFHGRREPSWIASLRERGTRVVEMVKKEGAAEFQNTKLCATRSIAKEVQ